MISSVEATGATPQVKDILLPGGAPTQSTPTSQAVNSTTKVHHMGELAATPEGKEFLDKFKMGIALEIIRWSRKAAEKSHKRAQEIQRNAKH